MQITKRHLHSWVNVIVAGLLIGIAIKNNYIFLGIFSIATLYYNEKRLIKYSWKLYVSGVFLSTQLVFLSTVWWFNSITAGGWSESVWILSPQQWLMCSLVFASFLVSFVAIAPRLILKKYYEKHMHLEGFALSWSMALVITEILMSLAMSQITRGNGVPLIPSWNFWSSALLIPDIKVGSFIKSTFGFWGSSFILYIFVATCLDTLGRIRLIHTKKRLIQSLLPLLILVFGVGLLILLSTVIFDRNKLAQDDIEVVAVSSRASSNAYLEAISKETTNNKDTIVVLPEYSSLLNPFPAGILSINNKDYLDTIRQNTSANTLIIGTEDEYRDGKRFVVSYILNNELSVIRTRQKQFLVPGGEYITPWIDDLVSIFDSKSLDKFTEERGRHVLNNSVEINKDTELTRQIGLGACSSILTPFAYQHEVARGARILTTSVSYEQFKRTPQYEKYAERFAVFNAQALKTPLVLSAFDGKALVIDSNGSIIQTKKDGIIRTTVNLRTSTSLYARLGDRTIFLTILIAAGIYLYFLRKRRL